MSEGQFPPKFLILQSPGHLRDWAVVDTLCWSPRLWQVPWQCLVLRYIRGFRWENGEGRGWGASGQHTTRHRHRSQGGVPQRALFRHLGSEVGSQTCWVCVNEDADPDHGASLQEHQELREGGLRTPCPSSPGPQGSNSVLPFCILKILPISWGPAINEGPISLSAVGKELLP